MKNQEIRKRFPMTKEFNKKSTNDWLYGYLQSVSTVDSDKRTIVYKDKVNLAQLALLAPKNEKNKPPSRSKMSRDFNKLIALGFINEIKVVGVKGNMVDVYELPYDKQELYKLIPLETLSYLLDVCTMNVIKIYIYLLNKYQWKLKEDDYYRFSLGEIIRECLGLKSTTHGRDYILVQNCLDALMKLKLINLSKDYGRVNGQLTSYFKLNEVRTHVIKESIFEK